MITFSLQSGSNGNSFFVEAGGVRLLFDAGLTGAAAQRRMKIHNRNMHDVDALIISHDHTDHSRYAGVYQRKFGMPIYITRKTQEAIWHDLGNLTDVRHFRSGETLEFGPVTVHTIPTPHDAADGVAFVVACDGKRLGILSDLGHVFDGLSSILESVDAAYLESNYDPDLLERSDYPFHLKARIRGDGGHISNAEAAGLVAGCGRNRPSWIAVTHLSRDNNRPDLAVAAHHDALGTEYPVYHAPRYTTSELWQV